jgi:hypothetical protein
MPHSYFDTHDGETFISDEVGLELDGIEAAHVALCNVMSDVVTVSDQRAVFVRVRDDVDDVVLKAGLSLVVEMGEPGEGGAT